MSLVREVRIFRSNDTLEVVRRFWESHQRNPNADFEHFRVVCDLRDNVLHPWVATVWENGDCRALLAGRLEASRIEPKIGYQSLVGFSCRVLTVVHGGLIGEVDANAASLLLGAVSESLAKGEFSMTSFNLISEDFPAMWEALRTHRPAALGAPRPTWSNHRSLTLPRTPGFLLEQMSSKSRNTLKRKEKKLEQAFPGQIAWRWIKPGSDDFADVCARMEKVARTTYQRGLGAGFIDTEEDRQRLGVFRDRGQLRVFLVEISGEPMAFWLGTVYGGTFHSNALGYRPEIADYGVGTLMFYRMVDELVGEGIECLDYGTGDADYKERHSDKCWREASAQLFAPTATGRLMRSYVDASAGLDRVGRAVAQRLGVTEKIKQTWRGRLRRSA